MPEIEEEKVMNPFTNRFVKVNSAAYGKMQEKMKLANLEVVQPEIKEMEPKPSELQSSLSDKLTDIVQENKSKFSKDMSKKEMDILLKKLLLKKLKLTDKTPKKKKKKQKYVVSSSDSDSDSDSD